MFLTVWSLPSFCWARLHSASLCMMTTDFYSLGKKCLCKQEPPQCENKPHASLRQSFYHLSSSPAGCFPPLLQKLPATFVSCCFRTPHSFSLWVWVWCLWRDALDSSGEEGREGGQRWTRTDWSCQVQVYTPLLPPGTPCGWCQVDWRTLAPLAWSQHCWAREGCHLEKFVMLHALWTSSCMWQRSILVLLDTRDGCRSQLLMHWGGFQSFLCGSAPLPVLWVFHKLLAEKLGRGQTSWSLWPWRN